MCKSVALNLLEFTKMRFRLLGSVQVSGFEFTKMQFVYWVVCNSVALNLLLG